MSISNKENKVIRKKTLKITKSVTKLKVMECQTHTRQACDRTVSQLDEVLRF
jgi:hypothetical protein